MFPYKLVVIASLLYAISIYETAHRNAVLLDSGRHVYLSSTASAEMTGSDKVLESESDCTIAGLGARQCLLPITPSPTLSIVQGGWRRGGMASSLCASVISSVKGDNRIYLMVC